jgi:hypothetical protein
MENIIFYKNQNNSYHIIEIKNLNVLFFEFRDLNILSYLPRYYSNFVNICGFFVNLCVIAITQKTQKITQRITKSIFGYKLFDNFNDI